MMFWYYEENQFQKPSESAKGAMWDLAGEGWRSCYRKYIGKKVDDLNTPNYFRLKKLASQTLGIADLGSNWKVGRYSQALYVEKLEAALATRHQIAHGTQGSVTVGKGTARDTIALIERLAGFVEAAVAANEAALDLGTLDFE